MIFFTVTKPRSKKKNNPQDPLKHAKEINNEKLNLFLDSFLHSTSSNSLELAETTLLHHCSEAH
jgi:hypothetical protein